MLKKLGMNVLSVANGKEAVQYFQNNKQSEKCDLVLLDLHMPVMDGWEAVSLIRHLPTGKDVPIVALSADVLAETKFACLQAGMNDHLSKPFTYDSLTEIIRTWITGKKEEDESYWSYLDIKNRDFSMNLS